jgi:hypothetical protein
MLRAVSVYISMEIAPQQKTRKGASVFLHLRYEFRR